ncbi:hypothetical protein MMC30_001577 [Trapelia coarctata]|nr:hypothetical protein [Trapelia coarctata]
MKASIFLLLSALSATLAAPSPTPDPALAPEISEDHVLKGRAAGTALVQFFYDNGCTYFNSQAFVGSAQPVGSSPPVVGGKWGTQSAMYVSTGGLVNWVIQTNKKDSKGFPLGMAQKPPIGKCIHFMNQGIEAWGTNNGDVVVHF